MSYIQGSHQAAISSLLEVIRVDPYVFPAWTTLASCYEEMGDREAARQMRFFGAHVDNDEEVWKELASEFRCGSLELVVISADVVELGRADRPSSACTA